MTIGFRFAGAVALATLAGCSAPPSVDQPDTPTGDAIALTKASESLAGITVERVQAQTALTTVEAVGTVAVDERRTARIGARVEAVVTDTPANVGDRVSTNTRLASLHSHELHDGWAAYRKAAAERRRAEEERRLAEDTLARTERLFADKAASSMEVERARAARASAIEQLAAADAEQRRAHEALAHLGVEPTAVSDSEADHAPIPVRSPIAGVVLERLVTPGTAVTPGTPIFVVSDTSHLWVLAEVDETAVGRVHVGATAAIRVAAHDEPFIGRVAQIGDTVSTTTRRVVVRCDVANPDGRLKPGMFARLSIGEPTAATVIRVPIDAVQDLGERRVVFAPAGEGRYEPRDVTTGAERDGRIEVRSGLSDGDAIVTRGAFLLKSQLLVSAEVD